MGVKATEAPQAQIHLRLLHQDADGVLMLLLVPECAPLLIATLGLGDLTPTARRSLLTGHHLPQNDWNQQG